MIIPGASPTGQMGGGSLHPSFPVVGRSLTKGLEVAIPVGLTVISLVGVGKFFKAAGALRAANAALIRLYQTGRIPLLGGSTYYPPGWIGPSLTIMGGTASTWFTPDTSSGGGGPGEIPNLHRPPPSIEETGDILSNPSIMGEVPSSPRPSTSKKASSRFPESPRCSKRATHSRWGLRRCYRKRGHRGEHKFFKYHNT